MKSEQINKPLWAVTDGVNTVMTNTHKFVPAFRFKKHAIEYKKHLTKMGIKNLKIRNVSITII